MTVELELVNAHAGYGSVEVLHGVGLALPTGAVVAVVGRNGAGKTTLLRTIAGTLPLNSGTVCWQGRDVTNQTAQQRATVGLTFVPDENNVFVSLTVAENLALFGGDAPLDPVLTTFPELRALLDRRAGTLSGGEQQMLVLCRALLRPGRVVLLDEVSRGLSPTVQPRLYSAYRVTCQSSPIAIGVAAAVFVAAATFAGAMLQPYLTHRAAVDTKFEIAETAANAITTLWTYTPDDMDAARRPVGEVPGRRLRRRVPQVHRRDRRAEQAGAGHQQHPGARRGGRKSLDAHEATAIVYTNSVATSPVTKGIPSLRYLSYRLTMQPQGPDWLITEMSAITKLDLTPQL